MLSKTIAQLMSLNLIGGSDIVVACIDSNPPVDEFTGGGFSGGFAASLIASSKAGLYLMAANEFELRIFDINKETGKYNDTYSIFRREEILKAKVWGLGNGAITLKTKSRKILYQTGYKFRPGKFLPGNKLESLNQKEQVLQLKVFFKANFK